MPGGLVDFHIYFFISDAKKYEYKNIKFIKLKINILIANVLLKICKFIPIYWISTIFATKKKMYIYILHTIFIFTVRVSSYLSGV